MSAAVETPREPACSPDGDAVRCGCGSLLARYVEGRIELKCRRCKRIITVAIEAAPENPPR